MNIRSSSLIAFFQRFKWSLIFLSIVMAIQTFISLEKIPGYPHDLWSSYFLEWWMYTLPFIVLGMSLVSMSKGVSVKPKPMVSFLGRAMIITAIFLNYLSILAIG